MIKRLIEDILIFLVFVAMLPAIPFIILLSKYHEWLHKDDKPNY